MAEVTIAVAKDNNSRAQPDGDQKRGRGKGTTLIVGRDKPDDIAYHCKANLQFNIDWSDIQRVTSAFLELSLVTDNPNGKVRIRPRTKGWSEGTHTTFHADDYVADNVNDSQMFGASPRTGRVAIDIRRLLVLWAPKAVIVDGYGNGKAQSNFGLQLFWTRDALASEKVVFHAREATDPAERPTLVIGFTEVNIPPVTTLVDPTGSVDSEFRVRGTFSGPEPGDFMNAGTVEVRDPTSLVVVWDTTFTAWTHEGTDWSIAGPATGTLPIGAYEVRARVRDNRGKDSAWTAWMPFTLASFVPTVTPIPIGEQVSIGSVAFRAPYVLDPTGGECSKVDIQLEPLGGTWVGTDLLWNESYVPSHIEVIDHIVYCEYRGKPLPAGQYQWRVRVTDSLGHVSAWAVDDTIDLLVGTPPDSESLDLTTGWNNLHVRQRIVLLGIDKESRGPNGVVKAIIENPGAMGLMWNATAPGALWFNLPADHPQVSVIEPWVTHYRVEQYRKGRWFVLQYGVIHDFDAKEEEVIFLGTDYLGLLTYSYEGAIQPKGNLRKKIGNSPKELAGSRYFDKPISYIIKDQLTRARLQENHSPVKFIQIGHIAPMKSKVTIYAHYRQRLNFIRGLIDSHRGATGGQGERRARLRVHFKDGRHQFQLLDNAGDNKPGLRLEYGSLLQGYQVIAMEDFITRGYGWGREPNASRPYFEAMNAEGVSRADWGTLAQAFEYVDVSDKQDLIRRLRNAVTVGSRVGKSVALALRVGGLDPFDGFDILDALPIRIQDGVVDTTRYGSGWWVIWKVEWFVYSDGHDELRLTVRPRGDHGEVEPNLIPSEPIHFYTDWKWGHGDPNLGV